MVKWINVSTSQHQLKLFDGNRLIKTYPIAVGKILTPSPSGTYTIINKQRQSLADHLECFGWVCQNLITGYMVQIIQLQSVRMSPMDVFECIIMMF